MEHKECLIREIGNFFGDFHMQDGKYAIDNGVGKFQYRDEDELLCDWLPTLIEADMDTKDYYWNDAIEYILLNCNARISNIRICKGKKKTKFMATYNVPLAMKKYRTSQRSLGTFDRFDDAYMKLIEFYEQGKEI